MIEFIEDGEEKREITKSVLSQLPKWFGIEEALNEYITNVIDYPFLTYKDLSGKALGFFSLKPTSVVVLEIYVCGIVPSMHRKGIGKMLFEEVLAYSRVNGYKYLQVKTVENGRYKEYDQTNQFYQSLGFEPFEVFPTLWDEWNPCQIYIRNV